MRESLPRMLLYGVITVNRIGRPIGTRVPDGALRYCVRLPRGITWDSMIRLVLRELLDAKGWSQLELARRARLRPATIHALYHNRVTGIDFETLGRLSEALGVEPGDLVKSGKAKRTAGGRRGRASGRDGS